MKHKTTNGWNGKKKNRRAAALGMVLFFTGLAVFLYPIFSDLIYKNSVRRQKAEFEERMEAEKDGAGQSPSETLYRELRRRNKELFANRQKDLKDPFSYEQPDIDLTAYGLEGNVIGFLMIPKIKIELPILLGANRENLAQGAVHLTQTSYPVGGANTNCVLAAHRGYRKTAMLRDIEQLEIGDEIYIENFRETLTYRVSELRVISPTDVGELLIQEDRDLVTLITCHPYRHNYQRYVVFCERVVF